ncbi:MAG: 50S ribosomal protein L24 [bacterium]|nr:50S ribosomal protein L24 [bacterium]
MKIKKGDTVRILSGKDRGKNGKVIRVLPDETRILVEGINLKKKHVRSKRQDKKGEVVLIPAFLNVSRSMLVCPNCQKPTRVASKVIGDKKYRMCKHCDKEF